MGNDWIIDVLADIKSFAQKNDLPLLAVQLEQTMKVARAETEQSAIGTPIVVQGQCAEAGRLFIDVGENGRS